MYSCLSEVKRWKPQISVDDVVLQVLVGKVLKPFILCLCCTKIPPSRWRNMLGLVEWPEVHNFFFNANQRHLSGRGVLKLIFNHLMFDPLSVCSVGGPKVHWVLLQDSRRHRLFKILPFILSKLWGIKVKRPRDRWILKRVDTIFEVATLINNWSGYKTHFLGVHCEICVASSYVLNSA